MVTQKVKVLDYLDITLNSNEKSKQHVQMDDFIDRLLKGAPQDMQGQDASLAAIFLFDTGDSTEELLECSVQEFYTLTAKILFLCKRARSDIQTAVAFLTTRVMAPTIHDQNKLARVINYLRHTNHLHLVLSDNGTGILK